MSLLFPLLFSAALQAPADYTPTEKRTLQSAVQSLTYANALQQLSEQCSSGGQLDALLSGDSLIDTERLNNALLSQIKLSATEFQALLNTEKPLQTLIQRTPDKLSDCNDTDSIQNLLDSYELSLFSLEIATPLQNAPQNGAATGKKKSASLDAEAEQLLMRSKVIAVATITPKHYLNATSQARHLHPDYQSQYVFKIEQGWRNVIPAYMGMHSYAETDPKLLEESEWLIFLGPQNHYIHVLPLKEAKAYLDKLGDPDWTFDLSGNLQRK